MSDLPRHPDTEDGASVPGPNPSRPWPAYLLAATVVGVVVLIVVLHLAGVIDPGGH